MDFRCLANFDSKKYTLESKFVFCVLLSTLLVRKLQCAANLILEHLENMKKHPQKYDNLANLQKCSVLYKNRSACPYSWKLTYPFQCFLCLVQIFGTNWVPYLCSRCYIWIRYASNANQVQCSWHELYFVLGWGVSSSISQTYTKYTQIFRLFGTFILINIRTGLRVLFFLFLFSLLFFVAKFILWKLLFQSMSTFMLIIIAGNF
jgi:hypothetical protein